MTDFRHAAARSFAAALVFALALPVVARSQSADEPVVMPTPAPMPSMSTTPIPYPAYGPAAPDVVQLVPHKGVPPEITLQQAVAMAVVLSPAFATERAQYDAIRAKYGAEQSALFPSLEVVASATRLYGFQISNTGTGTNTGSSNPTEFKADAILQQLIYDGGRVIAAIKSARSANIAGNQTLLRQLQTLERSVATAYYAVLEANATIDSSATLVREFEIQERSVRAQINSGAAARSDLANAQFQTAQARNTLVTAQGQAIGAQSTFATTIGLDADTEVVPQPIPPDTTTTVPSYQKSVAQGFLMRPDYLAAQNTEYSSEYGLQYARGAHYPSLVANGDLGESRITGQERTFQGAQQLGATLTIPIFDQGLTNYNVAVAASQLDQAKAGLVQTRLQVESDVRTAVAGLVSARASAVQAQSEVTSSRVALDAAQAQYRVGTATVVDVTTAEANLATAQAAYITAIYNVHNAVETYNFAVGLSDLHL